MKRTELIAPIDARLDLLETAVDEERDLLDALARQVDRLESRVGEHLAGRDEAQG